MKLFGKRPADKVRTEQQAFSTPFGKIGKGNIALPYINNSITRAGVILFGADNLYPEILNQMYYTSPIHGAIVDFTVKASVGGGVTIEGIENDMKAMLDAEVFMKKNKIKKLLKVIARDKKLHNRVHFLLKFGSSRQLLSCTRVEPAAIRYRIDGDFDYSSDWSTNRDRRTIKRYSIKCTDTEQLLTFDEIGAGQDTYPIPTYTSALNWMFLDGEQSVLQKTYIQNSIFPSLVIRRPKTFGSTKELDDFKDGLKQKQGADESGRVLVLTGQGMENVPEVVTVPVNTADNLFVNTSKEIKDNICFAHEINPSIMGIKVAGSLGNAQELEMSYAIFEKNVIFPFREEIEDMIGELFIIANLKGVPKINEFKMFDASEFKVNDTQTPTAQ